MSPVGLTIRNRKITNKITKMPPISTYIRLALISAVKFPVPSERETSDKPKKQSATIAAPNGVFTESTKTLIEEETFVGGLVVVIITLLLLFFD